MIGYKLKNIVKHFTKRLVLTPLTSGQIPLLNLELLSLYVLLMCLQKLIPMFT